VAITTMLVTVVVTSWSESTVAVETVTQGADRTSGRAAAGGAETAHPSGDERFAMLDRTLKRARYAQDQLIEILHVAQEIFGYLSPDLLRYVANALRLPHSRVQGVATFYHLFTFDEPGDHSCTVCTGTACFVKGADDIVLALSRAHEVAAGGTTADGRFTLRTARCLGSCGLAPVAVVDGEVVGHLDAEAAVEAVAASLATSDDSSGMSDGSFASSDGSFASSDGSFASSDDGEGR
jgi:bidirectional [NiFe] hydrogenase diaphorase subunit